MCFRARKTQVKSQICLLSAVLTVGNEFAHLKTGENILIMIIFDEMMIQAVISYYHYYFKSDDLERERICHGGGKEDS